MLKKNFFGIFTFAILNLFLALFIIQEKNYVKQAREVAVQFKMNFLKDSVTNFIHEFTQSRADSIEIFDYTVSERENNLRDELHNASSLGSVKWILDKTFTSQDPREMWAYILLSSGEEVLATKNMPDTWDYSERSLDEIFCSWRKIELPVGNLYFGITQERLYNTILSIVSSKIHNSHFVEETYYWINEIKNYKGGKDYAVRLIHPNPRSSEGMLLSTDMQDAVGDFPYERELEEINKSGECFNTYYFKKKDSDNFARKITYSKLYKPYNWIVCMGSYYDDIYDYVDTINKFRGKSVSKIAIPLIILLDLLLAALLIRQIYTERKKSDPMNAQAARDPLTDASAQKFGEEELKKEFAAWKISGDSPAIMLMDVDNFKTLNDTYGREAGDFVLVQIVRRFYEQSRASDMLIRWNGDKFAGVFFGMKKSDCWSYAQKLLEAVSSQQIQFRDKAIQATVSLGFSFFEENDKSHQQALERADKALKEAKGAGKNRARVL